jgi:hypothetical protein
MHQHDWRVGILLHAVRVCGLNRHWGKFLLHTACTRSCIVAGKRRGSRIQWSTVVTSPLVALCFEGCKFRSFGVVESAVHWWGAVCPGQLIGHQTLILQVVVVVGTVHLGVLSDTLLASLSRYQSPSHSASDNARSNNEDSSRQNYPSTPCHVGNEQKDIDQESQESNEQGWEGQNEQSQKIARRVGGRVEVSGHGQAEANERQESCDRMDDEDGRERGSGAGGQGEFIVVGGREQFVYKKS